MSNKQLPNAEKANSCKELSAYAKMVSSGPAQQGVLNAHPNHSGTTLTANATTTITNPETNALTALPTQSTTKLLKTAAVGLLSSGLMELVSTAARMRDGIFLQNHVSVLHLLSKSMGFALAQATLSFQEDSANATKASRK